MLLILVHQPEDSNEGEKINGFYEKLINNLPTQGISVSIVSLEDLHRLLHYLPEDIKNIIWTADKEILEPIREFWQEQDLPNRKIHFIDKEMLINNSGKETELIHKLIEKEGSSKEIK